MCVSDILLIKKKQKKKKTNRYIVNANHSILGDKNLLVIFCQKYYYLNAKLINACRDNSNGAIAKNILPPSVCERYSAEKGEGVKHAVERRGTRKR